MRQEDASGGGEIVTRPEPGLARGRWEAPAWGFWAALAVIVSVTVLYVLRRLRARSASPKNPGPPLKSS